MCRIGAVGFWGYISREDQMSEAGIDEWSVLDQCSWFWVQISDVDHIRGVGSALDWWMVDQLSGVGSAVQCSSGVFRIGVATDGGNQTQNNYNFHIVIIQL